MLLFTSLPVGFQTFHPNSFLNYQLNRAHGLGWLHAHEITEVIEQLQSLDQVPAAFGRASASAEAAGRLRSATGFLRIAEFFTPQLSAEKLSTYRQYRNLFDRTFESGVVRHEVPYGSGTIPAYRLPAADSPTKGMVLIHGGFDSVIEEFYVIWERIAAAGFDVIAFDGPGQGGARAIGGLVSDHDWEKPVAAILDHFELSEVTLVGISMGGYWCLRAAAYEPRIARVVSWPPVYDWLFRLPAGLRGPTRWMLARRGFMNWSVGVRTRLSPILRHVVNEVLYISGRTDPITVVDWFMGMNAEHLGSDRVTQDVLILSGEHDAFQPPVQTRAQVRALSSARSLTVRMFTKAEHADSHCQMGNVELACSVVTDWLRRQCP